MKNLSLEYYRLDALILITVPSEMTEHMSKFGARTSYISRLNLVSALFLSFFKLCPKLIDQI